MQVVEARLNALRAVVSENARAPEFWRQPFNMYAAAYGRGAVWAVGVWDGIAAVAVPLTRPVSHTAAHYAGAIVSAAHGKFFSAPCALQIDTEARWQIYNSLFSVLPFENAPMRFVAQSESAAWYARGYSLVRAIGQTCILKWRGLLLAILGVAGCAG